MIQQAVEMVKQAVSNGQFLQVHGPCGTYDIDLNEAIQWIEVKSIFFIKSLTISDSAIKFCNGKIGITVEDPDDYNADASNHVTGD